jgi:hypothetical protein
MDCRVERTKNCTLYLGDCLDVLPTLGKVDAVVTDPPYGESMGFHGDDSPEVASDLSGAAFKAAKACCRSGAIAACFWTMRSLDLLLDSVRCSEWSYVRSLAMHVNGSARPDLSWLPRIQPIVLFRNGMKFGDLHDRFSVWLRSGIEESGLSQSDIARSLGVDSRLVMKWSRYRDPSRCLPTIKHYQRLKEIVGLSGEFDSEIYGRCIERDEPRNYQHDLYSVRGGRSETRHPSEKPLSVVSHLCSELASSGQTILDPFMGSGTTGIACVRAGRKFIGIEKEEKYFEIALDRIRKAESEISSEVKCS